MADRASPITEKEAAELRERYSLADEIFTKLPLFMAQVSKDLPRILDEWERLRDELEKYRTQLKKAIDLARFAEGKARGMENKMAALREALAPFARYRFNPGDVEEGHIGLVMKVADIKRAREVLAEED